MSLTHLPFPNHHSSLDLKSYANIFTFSQRVALLTAWKSFESTHGSPSDMEKVDKQMPRKVKKRRKLDDDSFEEYMDYVFPADDESAAKMSKLLQMAHQWKQTQGEENGAA